MMCPSCRGRGYYDNPNGPTILKCPTCQGHGELTPRESLCDCIHCGKKLCKCFKKAKQAGEV